MKRWLRRARVDVILIAGGVVEMIYRLLQIEPGVGVRRTQWDRDDGQTLAETDGPNSNIRSLLDTADHNAIIAVGQVFQRHTRPAAQQVDLHQMHVAGQELPALGKVLLAIRSRSFIGGAEQLKHGDQLPIASIADLHEREPFHIDSHGYPALDWRLQDLRSLTRRQRKVASGNTHVCPAQELSFGSRTFVNVNVLIELDDVTGADLRHNHLADVGNQALVKIVPDIVLLQIRVHSRKWRRHGLLLEGTTALYPLYRLTPSITGRLATGSSLDSKGELRIFQTAVGRVVSKLTGIGPIYSVSFRPDGQVVASTGFEGVGHLSDAKTSKIIKEFS